MVNSAAVHKLAESTNRTSQPRKPELLLSDQSDTDNDGEWIDDAEIWDMDNSVDWLDQDDVFCEDSALSDGSSEADNV